MELRKLAESWRLDKIRAYLSEPKKEDEWAVKGLIKSQRRQNEFERGS